MNADATTTCRGCGRTLRSPRSVAAGVGPTCARNERRRAAAVADTDTFTDQQLVKADELLVLNGLIPAQRRGLYLVASSRGDAVYQTDATEGTCTCPAGERAKLCYHVAAAFIAARPAA